MNSLATGHTPASILVPVYNVAPLLRRCLDSIVGQSFTDIQIVLVNDGSTDGSGSICDEYAARDGRIAVIHKENEGLAAARRDGIEAATGEYLAFVDSDDWIDEHLIRDNLALAREHDCDLVVFGYDKESRKADQVEYIRPTLPALHARGFQEVRSVVVPLLRAGGRFSVWNKLVRASVIRNNALQFPAMKRGADMAFAMDLFAATGSLIVNPEVYYHHETEYSPLKYDDRTVFNHATMFEKFVGLFPGWMEDPSNRSFAIRLFVVWFGYVIPSAIVRNPNFTLEEKRSLLREMLVHPIVRRFSREFGVLMARRYAPLLMVLRSGSPRLLYASVRAAHLATDGRAASLARALVNRG